MKMPCELIVTHVLPTAKGALAKELVTRHGMTQVEIAKKFGVTSAAVSQYLKGIRGGNSLIDKSAYRDDFYQMISRTADQMYQGMNINDALCQICEYVKNCGMLKALYVFEGFSGDQLACFECPKIIEIK
ncbi:MAG: helix-turn-helix domain-containing protein [Candidatus Methanomethylophilaceae archaeon]|nr:helix-turn-helix domain-containing protein [Candidatus Methanomethylophilaceae archaeon]